MLVPVVVSMSPVMAALAPERNSSAPPSRDCPRPAAILIHAVGLMYRKKATVRSTSSLEMGSIPS